MGFCHQWLANLRDYFHYLYISSINILWRLGTGAVNDCLKSELKSLNQSWLLITWTWVHWWLTLERENKFKRWPHWRETIHSSPMSLYFVKVPLCITGKSLKAAVWLGFATSSLKNVLKSNQLKKQQNKNWRRWRCKPFLNSKRNLGSWHSVCLHVQ